MKTEEIIRKIDKGALDKFIHDFWEARKLTQKNLFEESQEAYLNAAEYARENNLDAEALIADAAVFELKGRYEEAVRYLQQAIVNPLCRTKGMAHFLIGSVFKEKSQDQLDNAIKHYEEALKDKNFNKKQWALNNLGNIFFRKADYERAAKYYNESILAENDTIYITFYNIGRLALAECKHVEAISWFDKAISKAGKDYDMHGCCYREMGTAYISISLEQQGKNFYDAISCWESASKMFDEAEMRAYEKTGSLGKSAVVLAKIRIAKFYRDKLNKSEIKDDDYVLLTWWPPEESGADGYSTPEERIFSMIEATGRDRYQVYNTRESSRFAARRKDHVNIPAKDVLAILRGWGSATPLIEDAFSACLGGGYFLKWRDKGIVIDPGLDFLRNFRASGFHMREVDIVIVSHDHTDHNADLRAIDDVFYEMYRRSDEDDTGDRERTWHYYLICDERTRSKDFLSNTAGHRSIVEINDSMFQVDKEEDHNNECPISLRDKGLPFIIHTFRAKHGNNFPAYSFRIECLSDDAKCAKQIGFTCDTEYYDELSSHFCAVDILVAHVSQPTLVELLSSDGKKYNHLGYRGVAKLIRDCKEPRPGLFVLGEFWAGFADMRIDITKGLKRICNDAVILPSSVGLYIAIPSKEKNLEVECKNCKKWCSVSSINVGAPNHEFGPLTYLCPLCRI